MPNLLTGEVSSHSQRWKRVAAGNGGGGGGGGSWQQQQEQVWREGVEQKPAV